jgi:hypothetical protein
MCQTDVSFSPAIIRKHDGEINPVVSISRWILLISPNLDHAIFETQIVKRLPNPPAWDPQGDHLRKNTWVL